MFLSFADVDIFFSSVVKCVLSIRVFVARQLNIVSLSGSASLAFLNFSCRCICKPSWKRSFSEAFVDVGT